MNTMENKTMNGTLGDYCFEIAKQASDSLYKDVAQKYVTAAEHYLKDQNYDLAGFSYEKAHDNYLHYGNEALAADVAVKAVNAYKELPNTLEKCEKLLITAFKYYVKHDQFKAADQSILLATLYTDSVTDKDNYNTANDKYIRAIQLYEEAWSFYKKGPLSEAIKGFTALKSASAIAIKNHQYTKALTLLETLDKDKRCVFAHGLIVDTAIIKLYISGINECREWFFIEHTALPNNPFSSLIVNYNQGNRDGFLRIAQQYTSWQKKLLLEVSTRMV